MKHVKHLLVLLLLVNCTTDAPETENTPEVSAENNQVLNCVDDLPKLRLTNNGTHSFEFSLQAQDYTVLHTQNISASSDSGWIEISNDDVLAVVYNNVAYGQKLPLSLNLCDNLELEIDTNNVLVVSGD